MSKYTPSRQGVEDLANAIIIQAVEDYRNALIGKPVKKTTPGIHNSRM